MVSASLDVTAPGPEHDKCGGAGDWWGQFHLHAFMSLMQADRQIELREVVWIKGFFRRAGRGDCFARLEELMRGSGQGNPELARLGALAAERMSTAEKRRFVYNLAQMCKSKGKIDNDEYEHIIRLAGQVGIEDTDADSIINSVFSINDTFAAIMGLLALGVILYTTRAVIVPLVIAVFATMIINKVEGRLARALHLRARGLSRLAAMVFIVGVVSMLVLAGIHSGKQVAVSLPAYQDKVMSGLARLEAFAVGYGFRGVNAVSIADQLRQLPLASIAGSFVGSIVDLIGNFMLVVVFTGFLVFSSSSFGGVLQEMNEKIAGYVTVKSFVGLMTGLAVYIACRLFGVDFAFFWALLIFLLNYVPAVGAVIASLPPIALAFVQLDSVAAAFAFSGLLVVIQVVTGQVLEPKLMGDKLAVNPVAILLGLIFWGFLWGLPGMFLAAPLVAMLRILASYFNFSRSFERLLAAKP
jgi:AI-2 transport protein TqsA